MNCFYHAMTAKLFIYFAASRRQQLKEHQHFLGIFPNFDF